jgi:predicted amidohydrolase YtcJ
MVQLELTDDEATILKAVLEAQVRDLPREIHVTHDRAFKQVLKQKEAALERVLEQLARVSR